MQDNLFQLSFEKWWILLLSLIPAFINLGIFVYIYFFLPQNKSNRVFSVFVILLSISQAAGGLMRMSETIEIAYLWNSLSCAPLILALPFGLLFALRLTEWHKKIDHKFLNIFLFLPTIFLEFLLIARLDKYTIVKSERWNWIANPENTLFTDIIYLWITVIAVITFVVLWIHYIKEKTSKTKRIQALLLASGYTIPFITGICGEVFFPLILNKDDIPLGTPSTIVFSITFLIALKKYQLFDYSPKRQWDIIIEQLNEGILIVDNYDRIMYANKAFCSFMEYEFSEIQGKTAHELFIENPEHKKKIQNSIEQIKNKKPSQYEVQMKTKSGKKTWILLNDSPYLDDDGNVIGSIEIQTNIDHMKEVEALVRESEKKYYDLFEKNPLPVFVLDQHSFKYLNVNEAAVKHYGYSRQEFMNMTVLEIRPEEEKERFINSFPDISPRNSRTWKHIKKDRTIIQVDISASSIIFDNKPAALVLINDVTEKIKNEEKLKSANIELETYIYKASHDLRAPLASILGLIQVCKLEIKDETSIKYFNMVYAMIKKLDGMLSEFLKSMVIKDAEKFNDEINFDELIHETLNKFQHIKEYSRLKIYTDVSLFSPFFSSKFIIDTIFQNLIENSIKYQNPDQEESFIKINISQEKNKIKIVVDDNGIGIEKSLQDKIFEMYYRANELSQGSGLGLYLVKKGIEKLNGEIQVSSTLGKGTTFTILI